MAGALLQCNMNGDNLVPIREPRGDAPGAASRPDAANSTPSAPWRRWFDAWDSATSAGLERMLRNQGLLDLGGAVLTASMRAVALANRTRDAWWSAWGLPTRREQERLMHEITRLRSQLLDVSEQLRDADDASSGGGS